MVVRINNNLWRIQFTYPQNTNLQTSDGQRVLGVCDNNIKTIFIADKDINAKETYKNTFLSIKNDLKINIDVNVMEDFLRSC